MEIVEKEEVIVAQFTYVVTVLDVIWGVFSSHEKACEAVAHLHHRESIRIEEHILDLG